MKKILYILLAILSWSAVSPQVALAQEVDDLQEYLDQLAAQAERSRKAPTAVPLATETEVDLSRFSSYRNRTAVLKFAASLNVRITNGTITAASNFSGSTPLVEVNGTVTLDASASIDASGVSSSVCTAAVGVKGTGTFNQYASVIAPRNGEKVTLESSSCTWNNYFDIVDPDFEGSDCLEYSYDEANKTASVQRRNIAYIGDIVIPKKVKYNGDTYSVIGIGDEAFMASRSLTSIVIPNSVTSIGCEAFSGCMSLTSITIPNSVTSISKYAFSGCSSLTSITIPNSVTSIGVRAFSGCSSLTSINVESGNTKYDSRGGCNAIIETATNTLITGCKNTVIPNSVTSIGEYAFCDCSSLTSITIPNSVTSIGNYAFCNCASLTSITIPNSVTSISWGAFFECSGLTSVTIPNSVTSIGEWAFYECSGLTSVTIPNSVTSIGSHAFVYCSSLTSITIPNSVTSIGSHAFYDCSSLTSITIPNSVTSIGEYAFSGCSSLTDVTNYATTPQNIKPDVFSTYGTLHVPAGCKAAYEAAEGWKNFTIVEMEDPIDFVGSDCLEYDYDTVNKTASVKKYSSTKYSGDIVIPKKVKFNGEVYDVTSIGGYAFRDCSSLTSITIPNSVTNIGNSAFSGCSSLTSITIPNSVTSIGDTAFSGCSSLTSITIPNSVTSIDKYAFDGCSSLTSIKVESGNTKYDSRGGCNAIIETATNTLITGCMNTVIPNSVTSIGNSAFSGCSSLTSITIPNSVTSIGGEAFYYCSSLTSITIPNSVTSIEDYAFRYCSSLTDVTNYATTPQNISSSVFLTYGTLHVPAGCKAAYEAAEGWKNFTIVEMEDPIDFVGSDCLEYEYDTANKTASVKKYSSTEYSGDIVIPKKVKFNGEVYDVTSIGYDAFRNCSSLTSITIPNSVTSIGNYAFFNCRKLSSVTIGNNVTTIGHQAFDFCTNLTSVIIPKSVTKFEGIAFAGCTKLISIVVESGNPVYDSRGNCNAIIETQTNSLIAGCKNTIIPNSVTSIGKNAFWCCSSLTSITIPNSVTSIGYDAFGSCSSLTSITIPNSVTSINVTAFRGCTSLTSINVETGNTKYDSREGCNAIIESGTNTLIAGCKKTVIPNSVTSIGNYAFDNCSSLTSITIPSSVTSIGDDAFRNCSSLTDVTNYATTPQTIKSNVFSTYGTLHVPAGCKAAYEAAEGWKNFTIVEMEPEVSIKEVADALYKARTALDEARSTLDRIASVYFDVRWLIPNDQAAEILKFLTESEVSYKEFDRTYYDLVEYTSTAPSAEYATLYALANELNDAATALAEELADYEVTLTNQLVSTGQTALVDKLTTLKQSIEEYVIYVDRQNALTRAAEARCGTDFFMVDRAVLASENTLAYIASLAVLVERVNVAKNYWNDNFSYVEISTIEELKALLDKAETLDGMVEQALDEKLDVDSRYALFVQSIDEADIVLPTDGVNYSLQTPSIADKLTPDGFPIQMGYKSNRGTVLTSAGVMQFERASAHTFYLKDDQGNYMILLGEDAAMLGIPSSDGATEWTGKALGGGKYLIKVAGEDFGELYLNVLGTKVNSEVVASTNRAEWTIKESELDELQAFLNMMSEENYTEEDLANMDEDEKAAAEKDLVYVIPEPITDKTDKVIYIPCRPGRVIIKGYLPVPNRKDSKWGQDEHPIVVPKGSRLVLDDVKFDSENVGGDHVIHITGEVTVNVTVNIDDEWLKLWDWFFRLGTDGVLHWHPAGHRPAIKNEGGYVYIEPGSSTGKIDNTGEVLIAENTTVDEIVNKQGGTINQNGGRVVKVVNRYVYVFVGGYIGGCENGTGANFTMTGGNIGNNDVTHKDVVFVNYGKFIFRGGHIGGYGSHLFRHHPGAYLRIEGGDIDDSHVTNFIEAYDDFYMSGGFKPHKPIVINPGVRIHVINDIKYIWNIQFVGGVLPDLRVPFLVGTKFHPLTLLDWRRIGYRLPAHYRWRFRPAYKFMDDDGNGNSEEIESGALEIADENVEDEDDLQAYLDWLASQNEEASETGETTDYDYADTEDEPAVMNLPEEVMYITKYIYIPVGHHVHFKGGEIRPKVKFDNPIFHVPAGGWMHTTDVVINLLDITSDWTLFNIGGHFRFGKGSWLKGWMPARGLYYDNAMHGHCINIGKDAHFVLDGGRIDNIVLNTETYIYLNVTLTHNLFINPDASILYKGYQLVKPYLSGFGMTIADVALMIHPNRNFAWSFGLDRYGCVALYDKINSFDYDYEVPAGWSWMSFSLPAEQMFMKSFAEQASGYAGSLMRIQDARNELIYDDVLGFVGGLESLVPEAGYHVQANSAFTMNVSSDAPLMSEDATLSIKKGWNWLGYTPQVALPVDIALSYMTPSEGDLVKTYAGGFATYHNGAWVGNLILQPGEGLMYQASADMNARYVPTRPVVNEYVPAAKVMREGWDNDVLPAQWVSPVGRYELNMSIIANIFDHEGNSLDTEDLVIGAFCGGECRGICQSSDSDLKFLTVYGDTKANELLEFKIYDKLNERVYDVYEKVAFDNKLVGTIDNPQHLTISSICTPVESIAIDAPKNDVYNIMGIRQNTTKMNSRPLPHGVYILNGKKIIVK